MTDFKLKYEILKAQICWASWCFASWSPTRALPWTYWGTYSTLQTPCWFHHIFGMRKGLPCTKWIWNTKTVVWESAWKNPWCVNTTAHLEHLQFIYLFIYSFIYVNISFKTWKTVLKYVNYTMVNPFCISPILWTELLVQKTWFKIVWHFQIQIFLDFLVFCWLRSMSLIFIKKIW